jgi:hypothetical protein
LANSYSIEEITNPIAINAPPKRKSGVIDYLRKIHPNKLPTTGCAKKVKEATAAGSLAKA